MSKSQNQKITKSLQVAFIFYNENRTYNSLLDEILFINGNSNDAVEKKILGNIVRKPIYYLNKNGIKLKCEGEKEPCDGTILAELLNYGIYIRE